MTTRGADSVRPTLELPRTAQLSDPLMKTVKHELFELLEDLELAPKEFVIFGSGPLLVRGIIENSPDLDILCRGGAWQTVCERTRPRLDPVWNVPIASLFGGRLSFGTTWAIGNVDSDEVIDSAETIRGLPFARLNYVVEYKNLTGRAKDLAHLQALERYWSDALRTRASSSSAGPST